MDSGSLALESCHCGGYVDYTQLHKREYPLSCDHMCNFYCHSVIIIAIEMHTNKCIASLTTKSCNSKSISITDLILLQKKGVAKMISIMNLNLGIETCFYHGMTEYEALGT